MPDYLVAREHLLLVLIGGVDQTPDSLSGVPARVSARVPFTPLLTSCASVSCPLKLIGVPVSTGLVGSVGVGVGVGSGVSSEELQQAERQVREMINDK